MGTSAPSNVSLGLFISSLSSNSLFHDSLDLFIIYHKIYTTLYHFIRIPTSIDKASLHCIPNIFLYILIEYTNFKIERRGDPHLSKKKEPTTIQQKQNQINPDRSTKVLLQRYLKALSTKQILLLKRKCKFCLPPIPIFILFEELLLQYLFKLSLQILYSILQFLFENTLNRSISAIYLQIILLDIYRALYIYSITIFSF